MLPGSHLENVAFKWICPGASVVSDVSVRKRKLEPGDPAVTSGVKTARTAHRSAPRWSAWSHFGVRL